MLDYEGAKPKLTNTLLNKLNLQQKLRLEQHYE